MFFFVICVKILLLPVLWQENKHFQNVHCSFTNARWTLLNDYINSTQKYWYIENLHISWQIWSSYCLEMGRNQVLELIMMPITYNMRRSWCMEYNCINITLYVFHTTFICIMLHVVVQFVYKKVIALKLNSAKRCFKIVVKTTGPWPP